MATKVVTKKTLADELAAKYGWTKKDANEAVNYVFDEIAAAVKKGGEASINGFGKFSQVKKKARTGLNPATGEKIKIKATKAPKFKASKTFKDLVK
ncbi:MAG: HU family DNA-binding protein [Solobacterium sp.]|jgi:DNA-binding protein HU-beta|nr:HU family DNA-binding protein [Solobacterium sp.]MCH4206305.1 HU family DNA-binding protein [Solobacterium sp.]MCH4227771.1 HU family DNA-binding protein [Solobacterium sp.]MCH4283194.1 HU family DNA-binding protein [Solobacterium sp.]